MARIDGIALYPGRRFLVSLPPGEDLVASIERFCRQEGLVMATFQVTGNLSSVIVGCYDTTQQVFATHRIEADLEIVSCEGTIRLKADTAVADARILVSDLEGNFIAGRLFGPTPIHRAETILTEYRDPAPDRSVDPVTGLPVWQNAFSSPP